MTDDFNSSLLFLEISLTAILFVCLIRPDGRKYEGGWLDGKQHGKATYTNAQKKVRVGIWQNGKRLEWV